MKPLIIDAQGTNREIGQQHARRSLMMRDDVARWVADATGTYPASDARTQDRIDEVVAAWRELTPETLEQIAGMAEVYELPERGLLTAVLATYLRSLARAQGPTEGCTTFAVTGAHPLLVKNRDNFPTFLNMQTVLRVAPEDGYPWLALSTAGAPGVHSSGINAVGLSIADTHVPSSDIGPGVPRFAAMMQVLERCATTQEAISTVLSAPQMGLGNLTVLDSQGDAAVLECGYRTTASSVIGRNHDGAVGGLVATNHHVSPILSSCLLESEEGTPGANSRARAEVVGSYLAYTRDQPPSLAAVRDLAGSHVGFDESTTKAGSLCQHGPDLQSETISTVILDPANRHLDLCIGRPCTEPYTRISVTGE